MCNGYTFAQQESNTARLLRTRAYGSLVYPSYARSIEWMPDGEHYIQVEQNENAKMEIVTYTAKGDNRTVLIPAEQLMTDKASGKQLAVGDFSFSEGLDKMLIFTNTRKVWRYHTRGDYWVLDLTNGNLRQIGKDKPESTLMFAKFSPDGKKIAFRSQRRPGNEADQQRLWVYDLKTDECTYITRGQDYCVTEVVWDGNDAIYFVLPWRGTHQVAHIDLKGNIKHITKGNHDINAFTFAGGKMVANMNTISKAVELYDVNLDSGELAQLTDVNREIYDNIDFGKVEERWITTTDGKKMLTWVIYPPHFDPAKKYPTLLYCQGGPQSTVSQFWSYRWNFQLMAAEGYIIVAPNRRGCPSFGQEWTDQISGDYSGQNIRDYLAAIDEVSKEPFVDKDHRGCVGASYGGYSTYYLAGVHEGRFKAFIAHCGIFNFESMYGHTEELFFVTNDYGGAYWEMDNAVAQRSYANSPHKKVGNWDTPILIITGEKDYRIPYSQSLEAFTAARVQGIDARLVSFENEAHQVFQPQNSVVWNREFFGWLNKYLK